LYYGFEEKDQVALKGFVKGENELPKNLKAKNLLGPSEAYYAAGRATVMKRYKALLIDENLETPRCRGLYHLAAKFADPAALKLLIKRGVKPDIDEIGATPF
jgi:hypothetical protein